MDQGTDLDGPIDLEDRGMQATRQLSGLNAEWTQVTVPGLQEVVNRAIRLREETLAGLWQRLWDAAR